MPSVTASVVWSIECLVPLSILFCSVLMVRRRAMFPFNTRPFFLMSILVFGLLLGSTVVVINGLTSSFPCDAFLSLLIVSDIFVLQSLSLRAMYVLFQLRVVEVINTITDWGATDETKAAGKQDWAMRYAKSVISLRFYCLVLGVFLLIAGIIVAAVVGGDLARNGYPAHHVDTLASCHSRDIATHPLGLFRAIFAGLQLAGLAAFAVALASYGPDSGLAKQELQRTAVGAPALFIAQFILLGALRGSGSAEYVAFSLYMAALLWVLGAALIRPLWISAFLDKDSEAAYYLGRQPDISNLADIINSKVGYLAFVEFLKTEFSEENILFWREVQTFVIRCQALLQDATIESSDMNVLLEKKILNREIAAELSKSALSIFEVYCRRGAPAQVNISDTVLQELTTQLANLNAERVEVVLDKISNLFDSVKSQVYDLMDKDSFARFRQSRLYARLRARMVSSGWVDTSGGETLESFDLPEGLITVLDADAERLKALERRRAAQHVKPEVVRQQQRDTRASHMLAQAAVLNRKNIIEMSGLQEVRSPVTADDVVYPYALARPASLDKGAATGAAKGQQDRKGRGGDDSDVYEDEETGWNHAASVAHSTARGPAVTRAHW